MTKAYTVVLVQTPGGFLLINRRKPPYVGLWNALGGKVEPGETPSAGARREVMEESGLQVQMLTPCGVVHWFVDDTLRGDLYLFLATAAGGTWPQMTREGVIAQWESAWLHASDNLGLVPDLPAMLPLFAQPHNGEFTSHFAGDKFLGLEAVHA